MNCREEEEEEKEKGDLQKFTVNPMKAHPEGPDVSPVYSINYYCWSCSEGKPLESGRVSLADGPLTFHYFISHGTRQTFGWQKLLPLFFFFFSLFFHRRSLHLFFFLSWLLCRDNATLQGQHESIAKSLLFVALWHFFLELTYCCVVYLVIVYPWGVWRKNIKPHELNRFTIHAKKDTSAIFYRVVILLKEI